MTRCVRRPRLLVGASLLLVLGQSCASGELPRAGVRELQLGSVDIGGLTWLEDAIVFSADFPEDGEDQMSLWRVNPGGAVAPHRLDIPVQDKCIAVGFLYPSRATGDEVAFLRDCSNRHGLPVRHVLAHDLRTGSGRVLVEGRVDMGPSQMTWDEDARRGLYGTLNAPCTEIGLITQDGLAPLDAPIVDGSGTTWNVGDTFGNSAGGDCSDANASWPAWSQNGDQIAFFATEATLSDDTDRLDARWTLYVMSSDDFVPRPLLEDLADVHGLAWSPDGRRLAFSASNGGREGLWILHAESGEATQVSVTMFGDVAWSPDGRKLAVVASSLNAMDDRIILIDPIEIDGA